MEEKRLKEGYKKYQDMVKLVWDIKGIPNYVSRRIYFARSLNVLEAKAEGEVLGRKLGTPKAVAFADPLFPQRFSAGVLFKDTLDCDYLDAAKLVFQRYVDWATTYGNLNFVSLGDSKFPHNNQYLLSIMHNLAKDGSSENFILLRRFLEASIQFRELCRTKDFKDQLKALTAHADLIGEHYSRGLFRLESGGVE